MLVGESLTLSDLFKIETELDDLLLLYKIDLSVYHKIENQELIRHIDRIGLVFFRESGLVGLIDKKSCIRSST